MKIKLYLSFICIMLTANGFCQQENSNSQNSDRVHEIDSLIYSNVLTNRKSRQLFKEVKSYAENGDSEALCLLGVFYKDGIGTPLNFNKARRQFIKAYSSGSDKGAYSLGYLYLKGLGNIKQDYLKAIEWFQKSDYPMARHWLAKMYYFGYGVHKDKARAMELLKDNLIYNSEVLLEQFDKNDEDGNENTKRDNLPREIESNPERGSYESESILAIPPSNIEGVWKGYLMEMDWSGKSMIRSFPVGFSVGKIEDSYGAVKTNVEINETSIESGGIWKDGTLTLFDSQISIEKQYTDHPDLKILNYDLLSISFTEKNIDETTYLIGNLESQILQWSEPGPPMILVLTKEDIQLSDEALASFAEQDESFIKLYPNPFVNDLLIHYELGSDSNVEVKLLDYYGGTSVEIVTNSFLKSGQHTHTLSNNTLKAGLYVIQVRVNGQTHSKLVIKK
ncbi:T9SS type A sorting domain-containing protein [Flagellimonas sp. CMM7]|uniref:T9SS type A sorting domain-containing protein n=1 Tax=Flagellimonas sp. CMM7 TaxID=2654676 RepID=UPI0013D5FAED|nr:T9SS type A sorting domain-containing protein [Flagellimonas sp. CMM7]UII79691.1 T9SS type A sorting domain-containing protein [Flagellimonas sp. CMM7]